MEGVVGNKQNLSKQPFLTGSGRNTENLSKRSFHILIFPDLGCKFLDVLVLTHGFLLYGEL